MSSIACSPWAEPLSLTSTRESLTYRSRYRLVDDAQGVEADAGADVPDRLTLTVVVACRDREDCQR